MFQQKGNAWRKLWLISTWNVYLHVWKYSVVLGLGVILKKENGLYCGFTFGGAWFFSHGTYITQPELLRVKLVSQMIHNIQHPLQVVLPNSRKGTESFSARHTDEHGLAWTSFLLANLHMHMLKNHTGKKKEKKIQEQDMGEHLQLYKTDNCGNHAFKGNWIIPSNLCQHLRS